MAQAIAQNLIYFMLTRPACLYRSGKEIIIDLQGFHGGQLILKTPLVQAFHVDQAQLQVRNQHAFTKAFILPLRRKFENTLRVSNG